MTIKEYEKFVSDAVRYGVTSSLYADTSSVADMKEDDRMVVFSAQFIRDETDIDNADGCWNLQVPNVGRLGMIRLISPLKDLSHPEKYQYIHEHYEGLRNDDKDRRLAPFDTNVDWYYIDEFGNPSYVSWWVSHTDITLVSDLSEEELENFQITREDIKAAKEYIIDHLY